MFNSIQRQLMAWQAILLTLVVVALGAAFYLRVRRSTLEQVDADLVGAAQSLATSWSSVHSPHGLAVPDAFRHRMGRGPKETPYFLIWNDAGENVAAEGPLPPELENPGRPPEKKGPHPYHPQDRGENHEVILRDDAGVVVLVGRNLQRERDQLRRLLKWLAAAAAGTLALGLCGAWLLARRIARPLEQMTLAAEGISPATLAQRVDVPTNRNEIGRLAGVINGMLDRLQQAFERQQQFTSDASHELRTPVTVILAHTDDALAQDQSADEYREALAACRRAGLRMKSLIESLLMLARSDAGKLIAVDEVDLSPIVASAVEATAHAAGEAQVKVTTQLTSVMVRGDAARLEQVFVNLLSNAIVYNRPRGEVRVQLSSDHGEAIITVADTGIGIGDADLPHVFDRFYRVDASRSSPSASSGLGLAIGHEILRAHGGQIEVASQVGQGSTFTVRLPRLK